MTSKSQISVLDDVKARRASVDPSVGNRMLLEGFVEGRQFDLEGIAIDGHYHLLCIVEQHYGSKPPYFPFLVLLQPSHFRLRKEVLWSTTQKALSALE